MKHILFLSLIASILTSRQKIIKVTFNPKHYCALITPNQDYQLIITLNQPMSSYNSSIQYLIKASLIHERNANLPQDTSISSETYCSFENQSSERISCFFNIIPNSIDLQSTSFFLNHLSISNEIIYFQSQAYNTSLELNSLYTEYIYSDAFQVLDFSKEKHNLFYMTFTKPVDLIKSPNIKSIMLTNIGGNSINITDFCYSETINPSEPSTKLLCVLNPRINYIINTFYSVQYTDVCDYQINTLITIQIKGIVFDINDNTTNDGSDNEDNGEWSNNCPSNQYTYINNCYYECPLNTLYYNKTRECLGRCYFKQLVNEGNSCVKHCSKGYELISEYEDKELIQKCVKCSQGYSLFETCYNVCPIGSIVDKMGLACQIGTDSNYEEYHDEDYLEEDNEEEGYERPFESCEEFNPCDINGQCVIKNYAKVCLCDKDYYGFYCDISKDNMTEALSLITNSLYVPNTDFLIDVSKPDTKVQFALIDHLINQTNSFISENYNFASQILKGTLNTLSLNNSLSTSLLKNPQGVCQLVNLNLKIFLSLLNNEGYSVLYESESNILLNINQLLTLFNDYLYANMQSMITESISLEYSKNELISFMIWTDKANSKELAMKVALKKGISFADFSICRTMISDNKLNTYLNLDLSPAIASKIKSITEFDTSLVYLKAMSYNGQIIDLTDCPSIPIHFPLRDNTMSKLTIDKYILYKSIGIDIYNQFDSAFTSLCFITPSYEYDLPQTYRKYSIYENKTFISATNNKCLYKKLDIESQYVLMLCGYNIDGFIGLFTVSELTSTFEPGNKPIICGKNIISNLLTNCALWIYISLTLVFIFFQSLVAVYVNKGIYVDDTHNEQTIKNIDETSINSESNIEDNKTLDNIAKNDSNSNKALNSNIDLSIDSNQIKQNSTKHFLKCLGRNMLLHHPLVNIFIPSIMCPTHFKLALFFFSLITSFGFSALYFHEGCLETRVLSLNRNNFFYSISHEGVIILLSLISLFVLVIIIRVISFVPQLTQDTIRKRINSTIFSDERISIYHDLLVVRRLRDIISYCFMMTIASLLCYYSLSFCSNYPNSTLAWINSSLWVLILLWIVIAPIYILIISALEAITVLSQCTNVIKKLVFF